MDWTKLADDATLEKTAKSLRENGVEVFIVNDRKEAKEKALGIIPHGTEVMNMTSVTLDTINVSKEILESGSYNSVRKKLLSMDRNTQHMEMKRLGTAHEWVIGSVHAVTEDGKIVVASQSGSQLPAYVYGASHVIWVVGTQKIVKNLDEAFRRIREHCLTLEDARAKIAYGTGSSVNKILVLEGESVPKRITLIFVKENIGF